MTTIATERALIEAVAAEMSEGIESAVNFWMAQIENVLGDPGLTALGRLHAVRNILQHYRSATAGMGGPQDGRVA